jgi:enolase
LKITVYINFQGKTTPQVTYTVPINLEADGAAPPITDFKEACRIINQDISPLIKGRDVLGLKKIDDTLLAFQKKASEQEPPVQINDNIIRGCSEALLYAYGQCVNPAEPYQGLYRYLKSRDLAYTPGSGNVVPKLIFNVLNGGKALSSKVKFSRFYLILDMSPEDEHDPMEIYLKVQA